MGIDHKVALVTGASQGIGAGIVKAFVERGFNVVANSRNVTRSVEVAASAHVALVDASAYLIRRVRMGDVLDVSAPRGAFTLRDGDGPVVLLSAGVGATPVLAMLHALAAHAAPRPVWWIYGARNRLDHPFAREVRELLVNLRRARSTSGTAAPRRPTGWALTSMLPAG